MFETILALILNVLAGLLLVGGLFFMFVGAMGVVRLPDFYNRAHAAGKCVTLGIMGMLAAMVLYVSVGVTMPAGGEQEAIGVEAQAEVGADDPTTAVATKALLVVLFTVVAAPIGIHMLARAAHIAGVVPWERTLTDELAEDRAASDDENPHFREDEG